MISKERALEILEHFSYNSIGIKSVWNYYELFIRFDLYLDDNPSFKDTYREKLIQDLQYLEREQEHVKDAYKSDYSILLEYLQSLRVAQALLAD